MTLDIIVPHYNESWEDGKKLFDALALQRGIDFDDFRVLLVNDGEENSVYPHVLEQKYPYEVVSLIIPHRGVSAARNRGLNYSRAKWVMFCDFDDTFTSVYSLRSIMEVLGTDEYDLLWCPIYVEINTHADLQPKKDFNRIFIHGKVWRREFLAHHGICFSENLDYSEDTAFCELFCMETDRIGKIQSDFIPYVWTFRKGSATTDLRRRFVNGVGLYRRQLYVADEWLKRSRKEMHDNLVYRALCDAYVTLNRTDIECDKEEFEQEVREMCRKYRDLQIEVSVASLALESSFKELSADKDKMAKTFEEWLEEMEKGVVECEQI